MSERLAKAYLAIRACNLRRNETIGVLLPNIPEFVPAVLGANKAGLRVTFANPLYTPGRNKNVVLRKSSNNQYFQRKLADNLK